MVLMQLMMILYSGLPFGPPCGLCVSSYFSSLHARPCYYALYEG